MSLNQISSQGRTNSHPPCIYWSVRPRLQSSQHRDPLWQLGENVRETKDAHDSNLVDVASVCCWWRSLEEQNSSIEKGHNCLIPAPNIHVEDPYFWQTGGRIRHRSRRVLPKSSKVTDLEYSICLYHFSHVNEVLVGIHLISNLLHEDVSVDPYCDCKH